jgi:hypothetical protein
LRGKRVVASADSVIFEQLRKALGSKLGEAAPGRLSSKQPVVRSNRTRDATKPAT